MKAFAVSLTCLILATATLHADPRQWDTTGVVVRQGDDLEWEQVTARNDQGYVLVVWSSYANGNGDIYAQLINPDGTPQWAEGGVVVCGDPGRQGHPAAIASNDGWIVAWIDYRTAYDCNNPGSSCGQLWAQKLNGAGERQWSANDFTGIEVDAATVTIEPPLQITSDHAGGAIFVWLTSNSVGYDVYAQRIQDNGLVPWDAPVTIGPGFKVISTDDANGNVMVAWWFDANVMVCKISRQGEWLWSGVNLASQSECVWLKMCPDGSGGAYVSWSNAPELWYAQGSFVQHVSEAGEPLWTEPTQIRSTSNWGEGDITLSMNQDTTDGCIVAFTVNNQPTQMFLQKLSSQGSTLWAINGLPICGSSTPQRGCGYPSLISDRLGGTVIAWDHKPSSVASVFSEIRASRVHADGTLAWNGSCGVLVSPDTVRHYRPVVLPTDTARVFIAWTDVSQGFTGIHGQSLDMTTGAQRIVPNGISLASGINGEVYEEPQVVAVGARRTGILWMDGRDWRENSLHPFTYFQILDSLGHSLGTAQGDSLTRQDTDYGAMTSLYASCPDDGGGFFAVVRDYRSWIASLRAVHINSAGQPIGSPSGVTIGPAVPNMDPYRAVCTSDLNGGVYVAWVEPWQIYLTRLDSLSNPEWPLPALVASGEYATMPFGIVTNTDTSCRIGWFTAAGGYSTTLYLSQYSCNGQLDWSMTLTDEFLNYDYQRAGPAMTSDQSGGVYVSWIQLDQRTGTYDLHAQHLTADTMRQWGDQGIILFQDLRAAKNIRLSVDSHENLTIVWQQSNSGVSNSIMSCKLSPSGQPIWDNPVVVCTVDSAIYSLSVTDDGGEGLFVVWSCREMERSTIRCMHLDAFGRPASDPFWAPPSGGVLRETCDHQLWPAASADGHGHVTVAWIEIPAHYWGPVYNIYAQRLSLEQTSAAQPRVTAPRQYVLHPAFPNPFNPTTLIQFELASHVAVKMRIFDVLGRQVAVLVDRVMDAGEHTVRFDASALASGVYFCRLQAGSFTQTRKMVLIR